MKNFRSRKSLTIYITIIAIIVGGLIAYKHYSSDNSKVTIQPSPTNYAPPTQKDKDETQAHKEELAKKYQDQQNNPTSSTAKQAVNPVITNASQAGTQVMVNTYVSGVFENGGICTTTFSRGSLQIIKKTTAFANATTTDCPPTIVNSSEFSQKGDWQVTVSYASSKASGVSQAQGLTVK